MESGTDVTPIAEERQSQHRHGIGRWARAALAGVCIAAGPADTSASSGYRERADRFAQEIIALEQLKSDPRGFRWIQFLRKGWENPLFPQLDDPPPAPPGL